MAAGSDERGKQELEPTILEKSDYLICDDRQQSMNYGEFQYLRSNQHIRELGDILSQATTDQTNGLRICDLTGIASQDIEIVRSFI